MTHAAYYNALAIALQSDYSKIVKLKSQCATWEEAWRRCATTKINPEEEWQKLEETGIRLFMRDDDEFPPLLREIAHPPFGIYVLGNLSPSDVPTLAIVGTRRATPEGKKLAENFAKELGARGIVIASGLALGIDAAAHTGCLEARWQTIAVLGNGLDYFYPRTNERLAKKILEQGGAIISEYPLGAPPLPYRFLERNRIVSGLSRGTLVIEAPKESGSLVTARFALEQNRDVFIVPGPVSHPNFVGSHRLIRSGAELVTKPEEILESFGMETQEKTAVPTFETEEERIIFETLRGASRPLMIDQIIEATNLSIANANRTLTFLVLKSIVKEAGEGYTI